MIVFYLWLDLEYNINLSHIIHGNNGYLCNYPLINTYTVLVCCFVLTIIVVALYTKYNRASHYLQRVPLFIIPTCRVF